MNPDSSRLSVIVRASRWTCAIPAQDVIETMRPLPVEPVRGAPPFVRGVAVIRGAPLPVVDLALLLGGEAAAQGRRFVTLRAGPRRFALVVDEVLGVSEAHAAEDAPPPLLDGAVAEHVDRLGALDAQAFAVLSAARLLPQGDWALA